MDQNLQMIDKDAIKTVLICRPNHRLGNQLLITPLVQEVTDTFTNCKIDLFVKGNVAPIIFENYENVDHIIKLPKKHFNDVLPYAKGWLDLKKKHYDLVINVDKNSSSGRLSTKFAKSDYKLFGDEETDFELKYPDHNHIAKYPVYSLSSYLSKRGIPNKTQTVALFSVTKIKKYEPYGNNSVAVDTNTMNTDAIVKVIDTILSKN